jgi:hypothetical protein
MPLIEDRSRASSMAVASKSTATPTAAVPAIGGTGRSGRRSATSASISWAHAVRNSARTLPIVGQPTDSTTSAPAGPGLAPAPARRRAKGNMKHHAKIHRTPVTGRSDYYAGLPGVSSQLPERRA